MDNIPDAEAAYTLLNKRWNVSRETFSTLEAFAELLQKWNSAINLVSKTTLPNLWMRHIIDSAQLLDYIPGNTRILTDIGSGGGFPGMILAILGIPEVHLIESDSRKAAFLHKASSLLNNAKNHRVIVHNHRVENLNYWKSDVVTARAFAPLPKLFDLCHPFFSNDTTGLFLKGTHYGQELVDAKEEWNFTYKLQPSHTEPDAFIIQVTGLNHVRA